MIKMERKAVTDESNEHNIGDVSFTYFAFTTLRFPVVILRLRMFYTKGSPMTLFLNFNMLYSR